jgi:inner membrane protein
MDSLTQITLGAACGEAVLGKKIGNRAMLWGAAGGLLPDLDTLAYLFTDEITALAFHRGFMHSILFSYLAAFILSWLVYRLYEQNLYKRKVYKIFVSIIAMILIGGLGFGITSISSMGSKGLNFSVLFSVILVWLFLGFLFWKRYLQPELQEVKATRRDWFWLFWISIFTHPILDSFTAYGTQLFAPFSDYRVALNNISIVDPFYTIPLLFCVAAAAFVAREKKKRYILNWMGISLSSIYMIFTLYHKWEMDRIFSKSLSDNKIEYTRFMTSPTILNNFLWQGVAEGDSVFYHGYYSFFDEKPVIEKFNVLPKNHQLISNQHDERVIKILRWFSSDYFNVLIRSDGKMQFNDLRYGSRNNDFSSETSYVFRFVLEEKEGRLMAYQTREGMEVSKEEFQKLFSRIKGEKGAF